jgi:hypothetical protein
MKMECPKCNFEQSSQRGECEKCGIIFAKCHSDGHSGAEAAGGGDARRETGVDDASVSLSHLFFYTKPGENPVLIFGRLAVLIGLIIWGIRFVFSPLSANYPSESFMHLVNLPFHEAGHVIFRPFGPFITSLGGTLGQFLMPLTCLSVFLLKTRDTFGASVTLWWLGQNLFDIAPYINDARSLSLPLIGGNFGYSSPYGFHDWEYILTEAGMLEYDHALATLCLVAGTIIFILSYLWGAMVLYNQWKDRTEMPGG